ncbi:MAG TPA: DNA polymerase III subunit chi [Rhodocyclaceae bacterium]|nr:DNA polymerase III subunit chi [Rhodocyclaceae bacterium]
MTEIKFYHNAPDRIMAACSITAKAVRQGHKVVVYAPDTENARRYDSLLWSVPALSFVPHVPANSPLAARTPVLIASQLDNTAHADVLINLDGELPPTFLRWTMLVEIVSSQGEDRDPARHRWQFYKERGYAITAHDLAKAE